MEKKRRKFTQCPNCGYTFEEVNNYCPNCGQENHDLNVPVKHLLWEFLEGTLHYDTKFWITLKYLLLRPGLLTEKFNIGQRASYVPPFRLYVFVSLVFFFTLAVSTKSNIQVRTGDEGGATAQAALPTGVSIGTAIPDTLQAAILKDSVAARLAGDALRRDTAVVVSENWQEFETKFKSFAQGGEQSKQRLLKNSSFMMFLLMPFFAYLLYLFYYRKRRNYVEHLMFSIHLHTFYFILIIVAILAGFLFPALELEGIVLLIMLLYLYFALKQVYKTSYLGTLLKIIPISLTYLITLAIFLVGTVAVSVLLS